ncbi:MAG TPA: hypothetical protein VFP11_07615, partial [Candidatus Angelobacter sp.]|nr:hypothetical protein [Candidatus Angelobacter sp.]
QRKSRRAGVAEEGDWPRRTQLRETAGQASWFSCLGEIKPEFLKKRETKVVAPFGCRLKNLTGPGGSVTLNPIAFTVKMKEY